MAYSLMGGGMLQPNPASAQKTAPPPVTPLPQPKPGAMAQRGYDAILMGADPMQPAAKGGMAPGQNIPPPQPVSTTDPSAGGGTIDPFGRGRSSNRPADSRMNTTSPVGPPQYSPPTGTREDALASSGYGSGQQQGASPQGSPDVAKPGLMQEPTTPPLMGGNAPRQNGRQQRGGGADDPTATGQKMFDWFVKKTGQQPNMWAEMYGQLKSKGEYGGSFADFLYSMTDPSNTSGQPATGPNAAKYYGKGDQVLQQITRGGQQSSMSVAQPGQKDFGQGTFEGGNGATVQPQPSDTGSVGGPTVQPQIPGVANPPGPTSMEPGTYGSGSGATVQPQPSASGNGSGNGMSPYRPWEPLGIDVGNIPGQTDDPANISGYRDINANYLNLMGDRDMREFGGGNIGGNSLFNGNWNTPDFLQNSAGRYGEANTDPTTRAVRDEELVQSRLANLSREDNELNRIAKEDALAQAAASGMLGSGVAAGAALRASRAAMLPIAQQDAQTEFNTASQNMDAQNRDSLADQQNRTGLLSQEIGTAANLLDSATNRQWQSRENNTNQAFTLMRDDLGFRRDLIGQDRGFDFQNLDREDRQQYEAGQQAGQDALRLQMQEIDNNFAGNQQERQFRQQRTMAYYDMIYGREGLLGNTLASIYNNPNLTAEQQRAAVTNAQTFYRSLFESSNQTFADGVPEIFLDPYPQSQTPPTNGPPANPPNPPPPTGS